jgi:hypothetical protein
MQMSAQSFRVKAACTCVAVLAVSLFLVSTAAWQSSPINSSGIGHVNNASALLPPPVPAPNPPLVQGCGLDIVLVLDLSDSISKGPGSELEEIKSAAHDFVNAFLPSTASHIAIVIFSSSAGVLQQLTGDAAVLNAAIDTIQTTSGETNWSEALSEARKLLENTSIPMLDRDDTRHPDLIVICTDGQPNRPALDPNGSPLDLAIIQANLAKNSGGGQPNASNIRIVGVGVGLGSPPDPAFLSNLQDISGDQVHPPTAITTDIDVILGDFDTLSQVLSDFADSLCGGTITVRKILATGGTCANPTNPTPGEGWSFTPAVTDGHSNPLSGATDVNGEFTFEFEFDNRPSPPGTVTVDLCEIVPEGSQACDFAPICGFCEGATNNGQFFAVDPNDPNGPPCIKGIVLDKNDIVHCTFINKPSACISCNAGGPYNVQCNGAITSVPLDGTGSTGPTGGNLTYAWTAPNCPGATFDNATTATPTLKLPTAPGCNATCEVQLCISDGVHEPVCCTSSVHVTDTTNPTITCPGTLNAQCEIPPGVTTLAGFLALGGGAAAGDNCDAALTITYSDGNPTGLGCTNSPVTLTRTYRATDDCGNFAECNQNIIVKDDAAPVITCPSNKIVECGSSTEPVVTGVATATDNCVSDPTISYSDTIANGTCPQSKIISRKWSAEDECHNASTCTQTITIVDTGKPTVTCPINVTVECGASTDPIATGTATASDSCDPSPTVSYSDTVVAGGAACPQGKVITRVWTAADHCGNTSAIPCTQTITVVDTGKPSVTCPSNKTVECNASTDPAATGTATASDGCDPNPIVSYSDTVVAGGAACPQGRVITRVWTATDHCGNVAAAPCSQTITVVDTGKPTVTCPSNTTVECGGSTEPAATGTATASDNCDPNPIISHSDTVVAGGAACPQGKVITRVWTATDHCGNAAATPCTQTITVVDTGKPTVTCPINATVECGGSTEPAATGTATASDSCDPNPTVSYSDTVVAGGAACPQGKVISRVWTATDHCGNSSAVPCTQTITVVDTGKPTVTCPLNANVECGASTEPAATGTATASDSCDPNPIVSYSDTVVNGGAACPQGKVITRVWTATDHCGNTAATPCTQTITVVDTGKPTVTCPSNKTVECNASTEPAATGTATASDSCDPNPIVSYSDTVVAGGAACPQGKVITRVWTATDHCGNTAATPCTQTITVVDTGKPTVTCPVNASVECGGSTEPAATGTATASDNCDPNPTVSYSDTVVSGSAGCPLGKVISRVWTATDHCGNTSAAPCTQTITVVDTGKPTVTCPGNTTVQCGASTEPAATGSATASDSCDPNPIVSYSDTVSSGGAGCAQGKIISRVWTATDHCGNTAAAPCTQTITVIDTGKPTVTCPSNKTVECNASTEPAATGTATASDSCDPNPIVSYSDTVTSGGAGCAQGKIIARVWTATDHCGNVAVAPCTQTITVVDTGKPTVACPSNASVQCGGSTEPAATGTATASDSCDPNPTVSYSDTVVAGGAGCPQGKVISRAWNATDHCGNSAATKCIQTITVIDTGKPTVTCPSNKTVECGGSTEPAATGTATASDSCDPNPTVSYSDTIVTGGAACPQGKVISRAWNATDHCGNSAATKCIQTITVVDTGIPVITLTGDTTINLPCNTPFVDPGCNCADTCSSGLSCTISGDTVNPGASGAYTIKYNCKDACNNAAVEKTRTVIVGTCNRPPTCDAGGPYCKECNGASTAIQLTAAGSSDPDGNTLTYTWTSTCPGATFSDNHSKTPTLTVNTSTCCSVDCTVTVCVSDGIAAPVCCSANVQISDSTNPTVTCPANKTVQCGTSTEPSATGTATSSDKCDPTPVITYSDTVTAGSCPQAKTIVRRWKAKDRCGNKSTCDQTIQVVDSTKPVITCPPNKTVASALAADPQATGTATATDNCDPAPTISYSDVLTTRTCPDSSTIARTWKAKDACGNEATCTQTITIQQNQNCPPANCSRFKLKNGQVCQSGAPPAYGLRVDELYDLTSGLDIFTFDFGHAQSKMWADLCGCTLHIFGQAYGGLDTGTTYGNPTYAGVYKIDITYPLNCCTGNTITSNSSTGTVCGTITPTFGANQAAKQICNQKNSSGISFKFNKETCGCTNGRTGFGDLKYTGSCNNVNRFWDFIACPTTECFCDGSPSTYPPPVISCPGNKTVNCDASTLPANTGTATATDSCPSGDPVITYSDSSTSANCPKTITRTWTATDQCGKTASCSQTITVLGPTKDLLFVVPNPECLTDDEAARKSLFLSWSYTVTLIGECASPAEFRVAAVGREVLYICHTVSSSNLAGKLLYLPIGIVDEETNLADDLKFQAGDGMTYTGNAINITDNTHPITTGLATGSMVITSSNTTLTYTGTTLGSGVKTPAKKVGGTNPVLLSLETGATQIDGKTARGRRVLLPWGADGFAFSQLNSAGKDLLHRALDWAATGTVVQPTNPLLFVVEDFSSLDSGDTARKSLIESWGYEVLLINSDDATSIFTGAANLSKVVYITENVYSANVGNKLTGVTKGVVSEEPFLLDDLKLQSNNGATYSGSTAIKIVNNSHAITTGFTLNANLTILTAASDMIESAASMSSGTVGLATKTSSTSRTLAAIEKNGVLIDNSAAAGRRVMLPWGGDAFDFSKLNANGKLIMQRSILWATGP